MHLIPASWSHLHILVSVFPSVGLIFVLGFYITSLRTNNEAMKRACLTALGILGLLAIPVYFSGDGSAAVLSHDPKVSADRMDNHIGWSYAALTLLALTGIAWLLGDLFSWAIDLHRALLAQLVLCYPEGRPRSS